MILVQFWYNLGDSLAQTEANVLNVLSVRMYYVHSTVLLLWASSIKIIRYLPS